MTEIDLTIRSNLEQYNNETLELVPSDKIDECVRVVDEILLCQIALNEALGRRYAFFKEIWDGQRGI